MPFQSDTARRYGTVSRALHWGMALLFAWQFFGMALRAALGRTPVVSFFVGSHVTVGVLLLALVLLRLLWARANHGHRPPYEAGLLGRAARLGHAALYALMVIVPTLAVLRLYGSGRGYAPFGIEIFAPSETRIEWLMAPANALHGLLAWVLLALIAGHVAMVAVHQLLLRDRLLYRMVRTAGPADPAPAQER
ncbi:cytochrome b/b6 domain-containing protein [Ancylobacter sp. Lp-2]|uniref:cytochrome b n=1 Tax=Ancylobacter sp. Lp-2 TaxID=2881339 RepID=UPI001E5E25B4|nr:cytochrome b/b6 domain-containing protein [Ancylobacter sp. Lp-2]MCB4770993.1 cytochrome b/b6 domain-containing protein [Ancylobacter sp. Lp-2]